MTHHLAINVEERTVCPTVNDSGHRVTVAVGNAHVVEKDDIPEAWVVAINTICEPDCFLGAAQVESKIPHAIVHPFTQEVTVVPWGLADGGKNGEVGDGRWVGGGGKGDERDPIKAHAALLKEDDLPVDCR